MRWKGSGGGDERSDSRQAPDCVAVDPAWFSFASNSHFVSSSFLPDRPSPSKSDSLFCFFPISIFFFLPKAIPAKIKEIR